ncbi:antitoxin VapB family protein [Candidatus Woesearchaeota archaeon]|nr:antitoxin VapB family protein [Candidatus Woesearchaeota archaeon]
MATKTITIMDDAYELLTCNKRKDESFSDVIRRSFTKKVDIMRFAGIWNGIPDKEIDEMEKIIANRRRKATIDGLQKAQ